jgi:hypothetical protein
MPLICPNCKTKNPVISIMPRAWTTRTRGDTEYSARLPRALRRHICRVVDLQWRYNPVKMKRYKMAKRGRPKGSKNKPEPEAVPK